MSSVLTINWCDVALSRRPGKGEPPPHLSQQSEHVATGPPATHRLALHSRFPPTGAFVSVHLGNVGSGPPLQAFRVSPSRLSVTRDNLVGMRGSHLWCSPSLTGLPRGAQDGRADGAGALLDTPGATHCPAPSARAGQRPCHPPALLAPCGPGWGCWPGAELYSGPSAPP